MYPGHLLLACVVALQQSQREPFIKGTFSNRVSHKVSRPLSLVTVKIRKLPEGTGMYAVCCGVGQAPDLQPAFVRPSAHPPSANSQPQTSLHIVMFL